jgi:hypothetical protein
MRRRRETGASSRTATTESSTTSPGISDDDRSFEPNSETDLTEPEYLPSLTQKAKRRKIRLGPASRHLQADSAEIRASETENVTDASAVELVHRGRYEDPADDTDEDLSKVPEDYGRSDNTRKLNLRLKDRWARLVSVSTSFFELLSFMDGSLTHLLSGIVGPKQSSRQPIRSGKIQRTPCGKPPRTTCTGS